MYASLKILHQVHEQFCLKDIIGLLLSSHQPVFQKQHCVFVNDIPGELDITMDKHIFCMLLSKVLQEVVNVCSNVCLHVFAHSCDGCLKIGFTDGDICKGYAVYPGFEVSFMNGRLSGTVDLCRQNHETQPYCFSESLAA